MPYQRPTLTTLVQQVRADITSNITGADGLLRRSVLYVLGKVQAGLSNLHYGYLDWISLQAVPWTATDEFLQGWGALKDVTLKGATFATGIVVFPATNGTPLNSGSLVVRSDNAQFKSTASATASGGVLTVPVIALVAGAAGNTDAGTVFNLGQSLSGVSSNGTASVTFTGGADVEDQEDMRARMLQAYQNPPQGGDQADYEGWALDVPGVTRAWCLPNGQGPGTVVVYFMMDNAESVYNGFPQGSNGVATGETRDTAATGDQLTVANYIYPLRPVTALVYAVAPMPAPQNFTIHGLVPSNTANKAAVSAAIADTFLRLGDATGQTPVPFEEITSAIDAIPGITDYITISPLADIVTSTGYLPTVGTITWT